MRKITWIEIRTRVGGDLASLQEKTIFFCRSFEMSLSGNIKRVKTGLDRLDSVTGMQLGILSEPKSFNIGLVLVGAYLIMEFGSIQHLYKVINDIGIPYGIAVSTALYGIYLILFGKVRIGRTTVAFGLVCLFMIIDIALTTLDLKLRGDFCKLFTVYLFNYIILTSAVKTVSQLILVLDIWLASMAFSCLHGILQGGLLWGSQWLSDENQFSVFCAIGIPLACSLFLKIESRIKKACYLTCMGLFMVGVISGASRGGILATGLACSLCWLFLKHKIRILLIGVIALVLVVSLAPPRFFNEINNVTIDEQAGEPGERLYLWKLALNMFKDHPIAGVGFGNYPEYYTKYDAKAEGRDKTEGINWKFQKWVAHSTPLSFLAETGVLGCLLLLWLQWCLFKNWRFIRKKSESQRESLKDNKSLIMLRLLGDSCAISQVTFWVGSIFITLTWFPFYWILVPFSEICRHLFSAFLLQNECNAGQRGLRDHDYQCEAGLIAGSRHVGEKVR